MMKNNAKTEKKMNMMQGHWVLAKLGKRVLRPGGRELTHKMLSAMAISTDDDVVEFAPGLGYTARLAVACQPRSYTAVELNEEAASIVRGNIAHPNMKIVIANAAETGLPDGCATKVYGEAMLTMQSMAVKEQIIGEAARLLRQGGLYGIHEIGLVPEDISDETKRSIEQDLAKAIQTNVRPMTLKDWSRLMESKGFEVVHIEQNPMHLLEAKRIIADEGISGFLRMAWRMWVDKNARMRVKEMRDIFRRYENHINAVSIVARKKA